MSWALGWARLPWGSYKEKAAAVPVGCSTSANRAKVQLNGYMAVMRVLAPLLCDSCLIPQRVVGSAGMHLVAAESER